MSRPSSLPGLLLVAVLFTAAGACGDDSDGERVDRDADVYAAAIRDAVDDLPEDVGDVGDLVVHVYALDDDLSLAVQVAVLERLEDEATIRFVDEFDEAVAEDEDGIPVKRDGVAIGLSALESDGPEIRLRVERYTGGGTGEGFRYTAERDGGEWVVERRGSFTSEHPSDDEESLNEAAVPS